MTVEENLERLDAEGLLSPEKENQFLDCLASLYTTPSGTRRFGFDHHLYSDGDFCPNAWLPMTRFRIRTPT